MLPISHPDADQEIRARLGWRERWPTLLAAGMALTVVLALIWLFGDVSPQARPAALRGLGSTVSWLAAALIGASATIAALMLATISLIPSLDLRRLGPALLFNVRLTVLGAFATISLAILALLLTIFPAAGTAQTASPRWAVDAVYDAMLMLTALMVSSFAVVLGSLYATIADVLRNLPQEWVEPILDEAEEEAVRRE